YKKSGKRYRRRQYNYYKSRRYMGKYFVEITSNAQKDLQKHYKSGNKKDGENSFSISRNTFFRRRKTGTTKARLSRLLVEKIKSERPDYISCLRRNRYGFCRISNGTLRKQINAFEKSSYFYLMNPKTFAEKVIEFNQNLYYPGKLPDGFQVLNPYFDNPETMVVMQKFYHKYYHDTSDRKFIIGINPSRNGAGVTGVPFTDTKRLESVCGIPMQSAHTHEISSVFLYDMIDAFGGTKDFYQQFYINSPFPLAIVRK